MNRKEFIKTSGRLLILGGVISSATYLILNNKVSANCTESPNCRNCGKADKCVNPEVKEARNGKEK